MQNQEIEKKGSQKYLANCAGITFQLYSKYQINTIIGSGAFAVVCSCKNKQNNQSLAVKKVPAPHQIRDAFKDLLDAKRTLRQIKILKFLKHKNIIGLNDIIKPDNPKTYDNIYLVFQLMQTDLGKLIQSTQVRTYNKKFTQNHIKYFLFQILHGIHFMHSGNIMHRDLKPTNLFVNKNCQLKIGDLNLARKFQESGSDIITDYVVTRWYRAPELLISTNYSNAIDIWSIGCIFAQLIGRIPIFKGDHPMNQLQRIIAIMGTPELSDLTFLSQQDKPNLQSIKRISQRKKIPWNEIFPKANLLALDLLDKMLVYNPQKRLTALQCLNHPYLASIRKLIQIQQCKQFFNWQFDAIEQKPQILREAIYQQALIMEQQNSKVQGVKVPQGEDIIGLGKRKSVQQKKLSSSNQGQSGQSGQSKSSQ